MKRMYLPLILLLSAQVLRVNAQTVTTYSVLSTSYNRASGSFYALGNTDSYWFLTQTQDMVVPADPSSVVNYNNAPTYVVTNSGNNTFPGMINDHSINYYNSTSSTAQKVVTYRTYFTLPNLATATKSYSLNFKMSADDAVDNVKLNGVEKGKYLDNDYNNIPGVDKPYMLLIPACDSSLRSGQNYIDVTIADAGGAIGFYAEITLSEISAPCQKSVGITEMQAQPMGCTLYPNPAGEELTLSVNNTDHPLCLKLFSIDGKLIKTEYPEKQEPGRYVISISELSKGLYYLNFSSGTESGTLKFSKE